MTADEVLNLPLREWIALNYELTRVEGLNHPATCAICGQPISPSEQCYVTSLMRFGTIAVHADCARNKQAPDRKAFAIAARARAELARLEAALAEARGAEFAAFAEGASATRRDSKADRLDAQVEVVRRIIGEEGS